MNRYVLLGALLVGGCETVQDASRFVHVPALTMTSAQVPDPDGTAGAQRPEQRDTISLQEWVKQALLIADGSSSTICDSLSDAANAEYATLCFDIEYAAEATKPSAQAMRNSLVYQAVSISDANCVSRVDRVLTFQSGGDTVADVARGLVNAGGLAVTDAASSRAASGIASILDSTWSSLNDNFVGTALFIEHLREVESDRKAQFATMENKMFTGTSSARTPSSYESYPLSAAVRDIKVYDEMCDLFQ